MEMAFIIQCAIQMMEDEAAFADQMKPSTGPRMDLKSLLGRPGAKR